MNSVSTTDHKRCTLIYFSTAVAHIRCKEVEQKRTLLKVCSKCRAMQYCSRKCQVADWPRHQIVISDKLSMPNCKIELSSCKLQAGQYMRFIVTCYVKKMPQMTGQVVIVE